MRSGKRDLNLYFSKTNIEVYKEKKLIKVINNKIHFLKQVIVGM